MEYIKMDLIGSKNLFHFTPAIRANDKMELEEMDFSTIPFFKIPFYSGIRSGLRDKKRKWNFSHP